ncbi:MAG: hypothetical protein ACR2QK_00285 [Acidimicrobiales bacterium]
MNDETLRQHLHHIQGEEPSQQFVDSLRRQVADQAGPSTGSPTGSSLPPDPADDQTVIDFPAGAGPVGRPFRRSFLLVAAAILIGVVALIRVIPDDRPALETATTTEAHRVGEAWLQAIVTNDKQAFVALHAAEVDVDDTLMGYSRDAGILTPERVEELYRAGFDAFQTSLAVDDDFVRSDGCEDLDRQQVRCSFTASMIGTDEYTYTIVADLTVENRRITSIMFETTTDPPELRAAVDSFFAEEANDQDRACMVLGFNTVGCGEHDSDFMRRYVEHYEAQQE